MNSNEMEQDKIKKTKSRKYIIMAVVILLLITSAFALFVFTQTQKPDPASEAIIREAVAAQLGKEPSELTDEDFEQITELSIGERTQTIFAMHEEDDSFKYAYNKLSDIRLLKKFTNLKTLYLGSIDNPQKKVPGWMAFLAKHGLYDVDERFALDLRPLEKLEHLEKLQLGGSAVNNIKPLGKLNLKHLQIISSPISDINTLKSQTQLEELYIIFCPKLIYEDLEELRKTNPNLVITSTINKPKP